MGGRGKEGGAGGKMRKKQYISKVKPKPAKKKEKERKERKGVCVHPYVCVNFFSPNENENPYLG